VIRNFFRLVIVITSFRSPGDVYCSRSVCYLPQGLSVECLNLQAPTFLARIIHRLSSRSGGSAGGSALRHVATKTPATPISPEGGGGTASISLSLLLHDVTDIASSSLRELDAVALATNSTLSMKRGTKEVERGTRLRVAQRVQHAG